MLEIIKQKANEIALEHAKILETECKMICEKFKCSENDLIIEYHANTDIKIAVRASHLRITNNFYYKDGVLNSDSQ